MSLPGTGSKLIGGSLNVEVTRDEVHRVLVDGFLPPVELDDRPESRQSGFQEFGLPFAPDPAITRYSGGVSYGASARYGRRRSPALWPRSGAARYRLCSTVGLFESPVLRTRLVEDADAVVRRWSGPPRLASRRSWRRASSTWRWLEARRTTAWCDAAKEYASPRAWLAPTTSASNADEPSAVCVVPASVEPGHEVEVADRQFEVLVSKPVEFPLLVSSTRLTDRPGEIAPDRPPTDDAAAAGSHRAANASQVGRGGRSKSSCTPG